MPARRLPDNPSLEHLSNQAKELQRRVRAGDGEALALVRELHPRLTDLAAPDPRAAKFARTQAQLVIARQYGFASWPKLREHVEFVCANTRAPDLQPIGGPLTTERERADEFLRLACLTYGSDSLERHARARELLAAHPGLASFDIHTIAAAGDVAAARALLERDPAQARRRGGPHDWEPLLYLAYSRAHDSQPGDAPPGRSALAVARLLLAAGADPNAGYLWHGLRSPFTALTGAFGLGEDSSNQPPHEHAFELARLLLEAGADANDSQALYNRHFRRNDEHLRLLFEFGLGRGDGGVWRARLGPALATPVQMLEDQLRWAAANGMRERVELLLAHGVAPDGRGTEHPVHRGLTAYESALRSGSRAIAELLLAAGADATRVDDVTRFVSACMEPDRRAVDALRAADPGLTERVLAREPQLVIQAAGLGRLDAVRLLVELGFDVNFRRRTTALHEAAWLGNLPLVELLLSLGADRTLLDTEFHAPPQGWAQHNRQQHVVDYLTRLDG